MTTTRNWFSVFWLAWALVLAVGFALAEGIAMAGKRHPKDTLSRNLQWLVRNNRTTVVRWGSAAAWLVFAGWFFHHIWIA